MSASLVRKGLELFNDDFLDVEVFEDGGKPSSSKTKIKKPTIGTEKQGMKKRKKRLQNEKKNKSKKKCFDDKKDDVSDNTGGNLHFFEILDKASKLQPNIKKKIRDQQNGRLAKDRCKAEVVNSKATIFTEKDFDNFEKEYNATDDFWN